MDGCRRPYRFIDCSFLDRELWAKTLLYLLINHGFSDCFHCNATQCQPRNRGTWNSSKLELRSSSRYQEKYCRGQRRPSDQRVLLHHYLLDCHRIPLARLWLFRLLLHARRRLAEQIYILNADSRELRLPSPGKSAFQQVLQRARVPQADYVRKCDHGYHGTLHFRFRLTSKCCLGDPRSGNDHLHRHCEHNPGTVPRLPAHVDHFWQNLSKAYRGDNICSFGRCEQLQRKHLELARQLGQWHFRRRDIDRPEQLLDSCHNQLRLLLPTAAVLVADSDSEINRRAARVNEGVRPRDQNKQSRFWHRRGATRWRHPAINSHQK